MFRQYVKRAREESAKSDPNKRRSKCLYKTVRLQSSLWKTSGPGGEWGVAILLGFVHHTTETRIGSSCPGICVPLDTILGLQLFKIATVYS